ncbi:tripartite tricarboxylate transporter TctB family protein [Billgrantia diversa]|uniref:tripartite tricarboxylate transporter TctB family protein n=1 Tax=Halomonas sp. MCCC 1A13316 TaxID=2733487 RepID=UPI0018A60F69|nr:tripartite tricarboxylate transporter TctB family protein [Halomonas sp. MCCC 1A13316]QOR37990.1 tripartite tricarboxylate transporter TctB family protein [Halomonas sp. MCCC 1A13316]
MKSDIGIGVFLLLVSAFFFAGSYNITQSTITAPMAGASFFPRVVSMLLAASSLYLIIKAVMQNRRGKSGSAEAAAESGLEQPEMGATNEQAVLVMVVATTLYILIIPFIGYLITTIAFMSATSLYLGSIHKKHPWYFTVSVVIGISLAAYVLFSTVLSVFLPQGILI